MSFLCVYLVRNIRILLQGISRTNLQAFWVFSDFWMIKIGKWISLIFLLQDFLPQGFSPRKQGQT